MNTAGEWKLGGVEYVTGVQENISATTKITPALEIYDPPEKNDVTKHRQITKWYKYRSINFKYFSSYVLYIVVLWTCGVLDVLCGKCLMVHYTNSLH